MMIFDTEKQAGQSLQLGTAARRALDGLLSSIYKQDTEEWLRLQLKHIQGGNGLHLASGNGMDSYMLAHLLDAESTLLGIDEDAAMIQTARNAAVNSNHGAVKFLQADPFCWRATEAFDFIYTRLSAGNWTAHSALLYLLRANQKKNAVLLIEIVALSEFKAYPYNHAFARAMELIGMLETTGDKATQAELLLQQHGFELLEFNTAMPAFIPNNQHNIVSLALEACRAAILQRRGSTTEELNALLLELREFEQQNDTLISRPGLLQITAR
ncbi:MAG: class I SAM-dependent methyltransferase [Lewinellaceae bacterium]|nr:class I SAM-dependent methyltransferase [Lewinellaceae bacterium]